MSVGSGSRPAGARSRYDEYADRLALLVASEEFALAFLWWGALVVAAPTCFAWALEHHLSGATAVGVVFGLTGLVVAAISVHRLVSIVPSVQATVTE